MTKPITLIIPVEMTAAQIIRASAVSKRDSPMSEAEARELAEELHAILEAMRPHPRPDPTCAFVFEDAVDAVRRTALGFWPEDDDGMATASGSCRVMEQLSSAANQSHPTDFALYDRYLRLCDRIHGTGIAAMADGFYPAKADPSAPRMH